MLVSALVKRAQCLDGAQILTEADLIAVLEHEAVWAGVIPVSSDLALASLD